MNNISNRSLIATATLGLLLALCSVAYSQSAAVPIDAGSELAQAAASANTMPQATPAENPPVVATQTQPAPEEIAGDVYTKLRAGQWLVAFGGILMLLVWAIRAGLKALSDRWSALEWFSGKLGGFVLAFGTTAALTVGTALTAGEPISLGLVSAALAAAWVAAGQWGHAKDVASK